MGRRKQKKYKINRKRQKEEIYFDSIEEPTSDRVNTMGAKQKSKLNKKMRKILNREQERHLSSKNYIIDSKSRYGFHKITVFLKDSEKMDKSFLITSIKDFVDDPFTPFGYFRDDDSITFYIEANHDIANAITSLSKRIPSPTGELMVIKVDHVKETDFILNCQQVELVKTVMQRRYDVSSDILNLSSFHFDPQFLEVNAFVPLSNQRIFRKVLLLINELIPNLNALDLSSNRLINSSLKVVENLNLTFPFLSALNLQNNFFEKVDCLRCFRGLPLKEVNLIGNKFYDIMEKPTDKYLRSVKRELPFLKIIDNVNISKSNQDEQVSSNASASSIQIQTPSLSDSSSSITEEKLKTFLEQYYALIDTPEREALLQAYIPTANIEVRSENPVISSVRMEGQTQIQEFLKAWPLTKHDHGSFKLEVLSMSKVPAEGVTSVSGSCLMDNLQVVFQFKRTMRIIPYNSGFCCSEDLLEIC